MIRVRHIQTGREKCVGGFDDARRAVAFAFCQDKKRGRWFTSMVDAGHARCALDDLPLARRKGGWRCGEWVSV